MNRALAEKLFEVRMRFCEALPNRLDELVWELDPEGPLTSLSMARIHRILHELCGSAGMIGEGEISAVLKPALVIAEAYVHSERGPTPTEIADCRTAIRDARELANGRWSNSALRTV